MKKKNAFSWIPRPAKACICTLLVIVLAAAYYIALGCPTFTIEQEFRRAEKAHMVGPSKIVDHTKGDYSEFDDMLVGETEYGICFFCKRTVTNVNKNREEFHYFLSYVEKTGNMTMVAAPNNHGSSWNFFGHKQSLPVYLFVNDEKAVRAEAEIHVMKAPNTTGYTEATFLAEADRTESGIFRLTIQGETNHELSAMYYFSTVTGGNNDHHPAEDIFNDITATVRLYDAQDNLIEETTLTIYEGNSEK